MAGNKAHTISDRHNPSLSKKLPPGLILILILTLVTAYCSGSDEQRAFERQALSPADGYTQTDAQGNITGDRDPDDWRIGPFFQGLIEVEPAFPNPALTNEQIEIHVTVTGVESIMGLEAAVWFEDTTVRQLDFINDAPLQPGLSVLRFDAIQLGRVNTPESARGLHRVIIFDRNNNIISYGDIRVE